MALPPGAQPIHAALRAWLKGVVLNSLGKTADAEMVGYYYQCAIYSNS